tara:strand:- start:214 stop:1152 length:939 start_codon:yes stop_codon:yes gene_type:complete
MNKNKLPIISIIGPTSIGKSNLAIELYNKYPVEIISVDSVMIFKDMNIGTAKPDKEVLKSIKHHLVDIKNPDDNYNVGDFYKDVCKLINSIHLNERIPLLVGGTLMYFNQLYNGLNQLPETSIIDRKFINNISDIYGWEKLHACLKNIDYETYQKINKADKQRIQRALEVYLITGKPISSFFAESVHLSEDFNLITLKMMCNDRSKLHKNIEERTKMMFRNGFIDEVMSIRKKYSITSDSQSMKSIGYKQVMSFINNEIDENELSEQTIFATRQLAKRQITWIKKFTEGMEIDLENQTLHHLFSMLDKHLHF